MNMIPTLTTGPTPATARGTVFIPFVATLPSPASRCFDSPAALDFFTRLTTDPRQQRPGLACCPALVTAARRRAVGLAAGGPWAHVDAAGVSPNEYARAEGCVLPAHYAARGNNIESLVAGSADAGAVFDALAASEKHAAHLFGEGDFFREQMRCGIAMAAGGVHGWYWVIMIGVCTDGC